MQLLLMFVKSRQRIRGRILAMRDIYLKNELIKQVVLCRRFFEKYLLRTFVGHLVQERKFFVLDLGLEEDKHEL